MDPSLQAMIVAALLAFVTFAVAQKVDPAGANPSDLSASGVTGGAVIDKTRPARGAASAAPKGTDYLRNANKERRAPGSVSAASAASGAR
jgi:hypothetical protein